MHWVYNQPISQEFTLLKPVSDHIGIYLLNKSLSLFCVVITACDHMSKITSFESAGACYALVYVILYIINARDEMQNGIR